MAMDMDTVSRLNNIQYREIEEQGDRFTFLFVLIGMFFGVVFYDFTGLKFLDELLALILVFKFGVNFLIRRTSYNIPVFLVFIISVLYLVYSFKIGSNVPVAMVSDWVTQIKPFIGFFCMLALMPQLSTVQKKFLRRCCWVIFIILLLVGLGGYKAQYYFCGHASRYATSVTLCSMLYLYCSELSWSFFLKATLMMSIGLLSGRSKFFGFFVLYELILFLTLKEYKFRWRIKDIATIVFLLGMAVLVAWNKINYYFIVGAFQSDQAFARPALYMTSVEILKDYFPFGSGYASFATYFSGVYYSSIYGEYGIDQFWGLSEEYFDFIADNYYPSLAQFGIVGVILFIVFFAYIYRLYKKMPTDKRNLRVLVLMGILFFLIESTSDTTMTHNRGFMFFALMALCISEGFLHKQISEENNNGKQE